MPRYYYVLNNGSNWVVGECSSYSCNTNAIAAPSVVKLDQQETQQTYYLLLAAYPYQSRGPTFHSMHQGVSSPDLPHCCRCRDHWALQASGGEGGREGGWVRMRERSTSRLAQGGRDTIQCNVCLCGLPQIQANGYQMLLL